MTVTVQQYRRLRRIFLRAARAYRFGCAFGPADAAMLREQQVSMVNLRAALHV
jgi:hypothetical protein